MPIARKIRALLEGINIAVGEILSNPLQFQHFREC